jgi:hypothetical protein
VIEEALHSYGMILNNFAGREFETKELLEYLGPGVPQMPKGPAPSDVALWYETESGITLRTREPWLGVLWWPKVPEGEPVHDLHITPYEPCVPYDDFVIRLGLSPALETTQGHPLADIEKTHSYQGLRVVVNQIVYSAEDLTIGLVGAIKLQRIFS